MKTEVMRVRKFIQVEVDMESTGEDLKPGDFYIAQRNPVIGWLLLKCKEVDRENGWVIPEEGEYCFDFHECHKVLAVDE